MSDERDLRLIALWIFALAAWFAFGVSLGRRRATAFYANGYCAALNSTPVADSLCVRSDSVVARVQKEASDE